MAATLRLLAGCKPYAGRASRITPGRGSVVGRACWKPDRPHPRRPGRSGLPLRDAQSGGSEPFSASRCCARARRRGLLSDARSRPAVHRQADRARQDLRRPGRDRDRERAPVRRGPGAHARARKSVESCSALGEVSRRSTPRSTQAVLDTIVAKAAQLSGTEAGVIYVLTRPRQFQSARHLRHER